MLMRAARKSNGKATRTSNGRLATSDNCACLSCKSTNPCIIDGTNVPATYTGWTVTLDAIALAVGVVCCEAGAGSGWRVDAPSAFAGTYSLAQSDHCVWSVAVADAAVYFKPMRMGTLVTNPVCGDARGYVATTLNVVLTQVAADQFRLQVYATTALFFPTRWDLFDRTITVSSLVCGCCPTLNFTNGFSAFACGAIVNGPHTSGKDGTAVATPCV